MMGATLEDLAEGASQSESDFVGFDAISVPASESLAQLQQDWESMDDATRYSYIQGMRMNSVGGPSCSPVSSENRLKGSRVGNKTIVHLSIFNLMISESYERQVISFLLDRIEDETVVIHCGLNPCPHPSNIVYLIAVRAAMYACKANLILDIGTIVDETVIFLAVAADSINTSPLGGLIIKQVCAVEDIFPPFRHAHMQWLDTLKKICDKGWLTQSELDTVMSQDQTVLCIYGQEWLDRASASTSGP